jgi:hypothetical protein
MTFEDALDSEAWLYVTSIGDDGSGRLRIVVCLGGHHQLSRDIIGKHANEIAQMPIEYDCAVYRTDLEALFHVHGAGRGRSRISSRREIWWTRHSPFRKIVASHGGSRVVERIT